MSVMDSVHEGDVVTGVATRKIKGGLLVDIGVPVFCRPARLTSAAPPTSAITSAAPYNRWC